MNEKESITQIVWDEFINLATQRLEKVGDTNLVNHLSEETFRLDYALSIYKTGINYAKVYCEYPYNKAPSQKLDIFIESGNGYCIEVK
ncbi:MAG: hypothetical protein DRN17_01325 [Thermoplasmata archaeon]|nr:MAG: hypothetical protein DRN17_01325 [Thermoplasmata archaeon]